MRLETLYLEGFGHFHQYAIGPLDKDITVLYGPNEAGKSTLLAFIRAILFGFPARGRAQHYPPLSGGRHGGRIQLTDDVGLSYTLERFVGQRGVQCQLRTGSGEVLQEAAELPGLTGHATLDLFSNVFAFSLDEIQTEGLLSNSEVASRIYSAGMGASQLPDFTRSLARRKNELFKPRGSAQEIAQVLRQLEEIDGRLREVRHHADEYHRLATRQNEIAQELAQADTAISQLNKRRARISRLLEGRDDWESWADCDLQLRELPNYRQLPENPIERLENLEERLQQARDDCEEVTVQLHQISEMAVADIPGENLLDDADRIEAIRRARSSFDSSVSDLPERQEELREMEDALAERLRSLGDAWQEENLDNVDTSLLVREEVMYWKRQLAKAENAAETAQILTEQNHRQLEQLKTEEAEAQSRLQPQADGVNGDTIQPPSGQLEELLEDRKILEQMQRSQGAFEDSVRDLPKRQAELEAQGTSLKERLRNLGPEWTEAHLDSFDTSLGFHQEVDRWKDLLADQREKVRDSRQRREQAETRLRELQTAARVAEERMPAEQPTLDERILDQKRNALRTARSRLNDYERAHLNLENLQRQLQSLRGSSATDKVETTQPSLRLPLFLGLIGFGLILAGVVLGQEALLLGLIGGFVLLGIAGALLLRSRAPFISDSPLSDVLVQHAGEAENSSAEALERLVEAAQPLELNSEPTVDALDNAEAWLDREANLLSQWQESREQWEEAIRNLQMQEQQVETVKQNLQTAVEAEAASHQAWMHWLEQLGVDSKFTPETMMGFMGQIDTARTHLEQIRQTQHRVRAIEKDISQYQDLVRPLALKYGLALEEDNPQRFMAVANILIDHLDLVRRHVLQRDDVVQRLQEQEQSTATAIQSQTEAAQTLVEKQTQWHNWLREHNLPEGFTPDAALEFLARAETAYALRTESRRMRQRIAAIEHDIREFQEQVAPLARANSIPLSPHDVQQLAIAADELIKRLEDVRQRFAAREQAQRQKDTIQAQLHQRMRRLKSVERDWKALLATGETDDVEEFRRRVHQQQARRKLERRKDEHLRRLRLLAGPEGKFETFQQELATSDRFQLDQESRELAHTMADEESRRDDLREELGRNDSALAQLISEKESSSLRMRRNILLEQLREHASEWSRLSIAEVLLDKTRRKFEQERQPSVIHHARDFFANVTDRRYQGLYAPIGEQTITVTDARGRSKQPAELSRGTREQLYLALRFGLIREFGEHAERLPVVVDEALVNFDRERARLAAQAFAQLGQTNQVLVFTCHRFIADLFADVGAQVLDISPGCSTN